MKGKEAVKNGMETESGDRHQGEETDGEQGDKDGLGLGFIFSVWLGIPKSN